MNITWIGHSCFKIESNGYTIITDPYEDRYVPGLKPLRETADMVLCSHDHGDHNAASLIELKGDGPCPFNVEKIKSWHDEVHGAKRGPNTIHIIEDGDVRLAHLGDLGCRPTEEQIQKLKGLNICLIPVGGYFTIDGKQAAELVRLIRPRTVIPMHYRDNRRKFGFGTISKVDEFTKLMDSVVFLEQSVISTDHLPEEQVVVLVPRDLK